MRDLSPVQALELVGDVAQSSTSCSFMVDAALTIGSAPNGGK